MQIQEGGRINVFGIWRAWKKKGILQFLKARRFKMFMPPVAEYGYFLALHRSWGCENSVCKGYDYDGDAQ